MSMMGMTAMLIVVYFATITFILLFLEKSNTKIGNFIFISLNVIFFLILNIIYFSNSGRERYTFLTFDNISPFTFTFMPCLYLVKGKIRDYFKCAIAFLSVGMVVAMMVTPQYAFFFNFASEARLDYLFDALCHLNCSLFGIYLVISGQVKLSAKNFVRSVVFMYSVITFVVMLNAIFHTNFFGMCPYGGYSIYMFNLFEEYWATLLAYYLGVFVVLSVGFEFNYGLNRFGGLISAFENKSDPSCSVPEKR